MDRHPLEQAGDAGAAIVRDKRDMMAALHQFLGQRVGRNHMSAGAAGREDIVPRDPKGHQRPLHFTT